MRNKNLKLSKFRGSHPLSALFSPILMRKRVTTAIGGMLSSFGLVLAMGSYPLAIDTPVAAQELAEPIVIETVKTGPIRVLPSYTGISQKFYALHPGLDITAHEGSPIYALRAGKVVKVSVSRYDYGRSVLIEHEDGVTSLYAHMGKIMVEDGQTVTEKTELGEVGLTGRTTGYHLHLEIRKNGNAVNPLSYLK